MAEPTVTTEKKIKPDSVAAELTVSIELSADTRDALIASLKRTGKLKLTFDEVDSLSLPEGFLENLNIND